MCEDYATILLESIEEMRIMNKHDHKRDQIRKAIRY